MLLRFRRHCRPVTILIAACGAAGCSGPDISTAANESPSALVGTAGPAPGESRRALAERAAASRSLAATTTAPSGTGRAFVTDAGTRVRQVSQPIWSDAAAARSAATANPFVATARRSATNPFAVPTSVPTAANPFAVTANGTASANPFAVGRIAATPQVHAPSRAPVQRVSHVEAVQAPTTRTTARTGQTAGISRAHDNRLPPAAPLGSSSPFGRMSPPNGADYTPVRMPRPAAIATESTTEAPPVQNRLPVRKVETAAARRPIAPASAPLPTFLSAKNQPAGESGGTIENEDMIVRSAVLPKRLGTSSDAATSPSFHFPITPRRTFFSPRSEAAAPGTEASTPIAISPTGRIPARAASLSTVSPTIGSPASSEPGDITKPLGAIQDPFAAFGEANDELEAPAPPTDLAEFAEGPRFSAGPSVEADQELDAPEEAPEFSSPSLVAGPALLAAPGGETLQPAPAPPAVATAVMEKTPGRLAEYSGGAKVEPVDLSDVGLSEEPDPIAGAMNTPVAVGVALGIVAISVVLFRRRFG